jgi:putative oxidoreductase
VVNSAPGVGSSRARRALGALVRPAPSAAASGVALVAVRVALAWIFTYYGAGKLFGAFRGPGLHATAVYFAHTAHLRPGAFFAVLGGVIEFGGALCVASGTATRVAAIALVGDQVMAMITVTWVNGINSLSAHPGYEFNVALTVLALTLVVFGAGRLSVDAVVERRLARAAATRFGP